MYGRLIRFVPDVLFPSLKINRVEKVGGVSSRGENSYGIEIFCKDVRSLKFAHNPENHSRREFFEDLQQLAFPIAKKLLPFAFSFQEKFPLDGWTVFEPVAELRRMVRFLILKLEYLYLPIVSYI